MTAKNVHHFLVVYDIPCGKAEICSFESDYDKALAAYEEAEAAYRDNDNVEVVLLGSDSIETLKRTHSSYFELSENHIDQIVARELAALGFR